MLRDMLLGKLLRGCFEEESALGEGPEGLLPPAPREAVSGVPPSDARRFFGVGAFVLGCTGGLAGKTDTAVLPGLLRGDGTLRKGCGLALLVCTEFALNWLPTPRPAEDALWPSRLELPDAFVGVLLRLFVELILLDEEAVCEVLDPGWDTCTTLVLIFVGVRVEFHEGPAVAAAAPGPDLEVLVRPVAEGDLALAVAVGDLERAGAVTGDLDR